MRYTKAALLIFGLGLVVGFVAVVGEFAEWERAASAAMAFGIVMLPVALFADGRGMAAIGWVAARFSRGRRSKRRGKARSAAPRRTGPPRSAPSRAPRSRRGGGRRPSNG